MNRFAFLAAGVLAACVASSAPYKTVIKGALIKERLDAETVRQMKVLGIEGVELNLMTKTLPTVEEARATRQLAERAGLTIASTLGGWFAFNEPERRAAEIEKAKRCIELTQAYGAPVMLIVPVGSYPTDGPKFPPFREIAYRWNPETLEVASVAAGDNAPYAAYIRRQNEATAAALSAVRELIPLAAEKGVVLALENVGSRMWMKPDYYHALVRKLNSPWVKFYFDLGNSINVGDPCDWLDEFGADIVKLHLKDDVIDPSRPWGQRMVAIGDGELDFRKLRDRLEAINYNGWIAVESDFRSDADHALILKRFIAGEPVWPKCVAVPAVALGGWRGETVSFRLDHVSAAGGAYAPQWKGVPDGWDAKAGVLRGVRYVTKTHGTEYGFLPDRVEWNGATNLPPGGSCVAVGSISVPADARAGEYSLAFAGREVKLRVTDRVLPPPRQWKMRPRAFWHHPWAIARVTRTVPWSKEHFEAMRPFLAYTAAFGHRTIMCTMSDLPWNHQCYDPNWTMIRHVRHGGTGKWSFDYSIFDRWVAFNHEMGIGPDIDLYSLCPWDYEVTYEDESGRPTRIRPKPGSKEFADYWEPFLVDLHRHLEEKGWLENVRICFDERSPEDVKACLELIRRVVPDMQVGTSGNGNPELFDGIRVGMFAQILNHADDGFFRKARELKKLGRRTYVYVCCLPKTPNTFIYSDPDDGFWLGVFPAAKGIDGLSRWTFDSFPENAMEDASYASWPSGETFLVYPDASPSWRYLQLLNGYQNGEKWRLLADAGGPVADELERLSVRYDVQQALHKKDGDFKELIADTLEILNR